MHRSAFSLIASRLRPSAPPTPDQDADMDLSPLQEVLDALVSNAYAYSTGIRGDDDFFQNELNRLLADSHISLANKIDGVTELTHMCFGKNWEDHVKRSHAYVTSSLSDGPEQRKRPKVATSSKIHIPMIQTTPNQADDERVSIMSGVSSSASPGHAPGFLQNCPEDLLLYIFSHLDAQSLTRSSETCRYWNTLIGSFEKSFWARLTNRTWGLREPTHLGVSWKEYFKMHWNIHIGRYHLHRVKDLDSSSGSSTTWDAPAPVRTQHIIRPGSCTSSSPPGISMIDGDHEQPTPTGRRSYVAAWPADPNNAYIVALDADYGKLAWVEADVDPLLIRVTTLDADGGQTKPETLEGHSNPIGLILSNDEGTLVSFDDSSTIIIWNLRTMEFERSINANDELGFIFSMNIHKRRIVTGGQNGRVIVWNADTGERIWSVEVDEKYLSGLSVQNLLNVAVWEDLVAYGIWEGGFWVGNIKEKREIARFDVQEMKDVMAKRDECSQAAHFETKSMHSERRREGTPSSLQAIYPSDDLPASDSITLSSSQAIPPSSAISVPVPLTSGHNPLLAHHHAPSALHTSGHNPLLTHHPAPSALHTTGPNPLLTPQPTPLATNPSSSSNPLMVHHPAPVPQQTSILLADLEEVYDQIVNLSDGESDAEFGGASDEEANLPVGDDLHHMQLWTLPTLFPMTLALNGHMLLTNGPERHQLAVWDLRNPQGLYTLSSARNQKHAASLCSSSLSSFRQRLIRSAAADIKFAEISRDGSMVFASTATYPRNRPTQESPHDRINELLVWDYRTEGATATRRFEKMRVGGEADPEDPDWFESEAIDIWVCWDEIPADN
ncbi:quinon protein alcohol dehydrogenase-like superfamily [Powellomyces hirtus]|nr:quinon protein alcohol dehydrogenase-like superfamily [Powellomyces hirtus]